MAKNEPRPSNIIDALKDKRLLGAGFRDLKTWQTWGVGLKGIFGIEMTAGELEIFQKISGRTSSPSAPVKEAFVVAGRRSGKSYMTAAIGVYLALFGDYRDYLSPGEDARVLIVAQDRRAGQVVFRYCKALLDTKFFRPYVVAEKAEEIVLSSGVILEIRPASHRSLRGFTVLACVLDELSFFRTGDSPNADFEIYRAVRPAMATIPNSLLIGISSPYRKSGLLFEKHRESWGQDDPECLILQGDSRTFNPTLSEKMVSKELEKDRAGAESEWLGLFRSDIETFLPLEIIQNAVIKYRTSLPPVPGVGYVCFVDPAGGGGDFYSASIGHLSESGEVVQDYLAGERGDPHFLTGKFASIAKDYGVTEISGDRYSGEWVSRAFEKCGITYRVHDLSKSEIYVQALPFFNSNVLRLLDNEDLIRELQNLERRTSASGRDVVDHPHYGKFHDDLANATCGMVVEAKRLESRPGSWALPYEIDSRGTATRGDIVNLGGRGLDGFYIRTESQNHWE